eukprot:6197265-Pleurochrysis_carterae.AAC.2
MSGAVFCGVMRAVVLVVAALQRLSRYCGGMLAASAPMPAGSAARRPNRPNDICRRNIRRSMMSIMTSYWITYNTVLVYCMIIFLLKYGALLALANIRRLVLHQGTNI